MSMYKEENHYYIYSSDFNNDFLLLEDRGETLVVWSYLNKDLVNMILHIFNCNIVFPYIESSDRIIFESLGLERIEFDDPDIDEETKKNPTYYYDRGEYDGFKKKAGVF